MPCGINGVRSDLGCINDEFEMSCSSPVAVYNLHVIIANRKSSICDMSRDSWKVRVKLIVRVTIAPNQILKTRNIYAVLNRRHLDSETIVCNPAESILTSYRGIKVSSPELKIFRLNKLGAPQLGFDFLSLENQCMSCAENIEPIGGGSPCINRVSWVFKPLWSQIVGIGVQCSIGQGVVFCRNHNCNWSCFWVLHCAWITSYFTLVVFHIVWKTNSFDFDLLS